jgi:spore germination protein YaaH
MIRIVKTLGFSVIFIFVLIIIFLVSYKALKTGDSSKSLSIFEKTKKVTTPPEISGWVAWWDEEKAYDLIQNNPGKLSYVSPVWFMVGSDLRLTDIGSTDKVKIIKDLKSVNLVVIPSLGSSLSGQDLSPLFNDQDKSRDLIENLTNKLITIGADGVDVDLEGIKLSDKDKFSLFLDQLKNQMKKNNLKMSVTIHAQTETNEWEGVLGQDIKRIGEIADEVRIMTYDKHSAGSGPGAISPIKWMEEVALFNSTLIDKNKIVLGIPSYGYVWTKDGDAKGQQFDEFYDYLKGLNYEDSRDASSKELVVRTDDFTGWLSDSFAMQSKIENLRAAGYNRFIIWHLGGMDEKFFEKDWAN